MGFFNSPSIVTDGLVLYVDAANAKSYPGSGTTWFDISGNAYNATLTNSPTWSNANSGRFAFNGSNQSATTAAPNITISTFTIICWIFSAANQNSFTGICQHRSSGNAWGLGCSYGTPVTNQLGYTWAADSATYSWNSGLIIPNNQWSMVALSTSTTSASLYLNSSFASQNHTNSSFTLGALTIAHDTIVSTRFFNGNIALTSFYNRALTVGEIGQNFNALRGRFGV